MTPDRERVHPPVSGTLRFWRAWAREHGGTVKVVHRNPRGVIEIVQGGARHIYHFDKYGRRDGKYSWGSSLPVDFLAQMAAAYSDVGRSVNKRGIGIRGRCNEGRARD